MTVARVLSAIDEVSATEWNALDGGGVPFLCHEFLAVLESTGCVGGETGWQPRHLILRERDNGRLVGAIPLYGKSHSWGEFVFDFSWAQAYTRYGDRYYPKLVAATPFTPATGPRLLLHPEAPAATRLSLVKALEEVTLALDASSVHAQFPTAEEAHYLESLGWLSRIDCQFHWLNHDYADFDAFLGTFTAEKRKKAKRERRRVAETGIRFERRAGGELDRATWATVHALHAGTFHRHGHQPYLSLAFFLEISRRLPAACQVILAYAGTDIVATAILFQGRDTLYGRYWGAAGELHSLHFETCYYQGIEYAIEAGLRRFEPGTQGEHKIARGFSPALTYSSHYIADPAYRQAIGAYLNEERAGIRSYIESAAHHVPYKRTDGELHVPGAAAAER